MERLKQRLPETLGVYLKPRVLAILFLGFASGLPLSLTGQTLQVWMTEEGVSLAVIGFFSLVALPYVLKFLWAPLVDGVPIPVLGRLLGRRRAWLLTSQAALMAAIVALGSFDPKALPMATAACALIVAFFSATQDIVIDAFRIESLDERQQAAGMANYVAAYRVAMLVSVTGAIEIVNLLEGAGLDVTRSWTATYMVMAALLLVGVATALLSREPEGAPDHSGEPIKQQVVLHVVHPFTDFIQRQGWLAILLFVMLFKFGDAFAGVMTAPFVLDIGFDKTTYGRVVKVVGLVTVLLGGFAGGWAYRAWGAGLSLWSAAIVQMVSNLVFCWLAWVGPETSVLVAAIAIENLAGGFGTVIFVGYISSLCSNRDYTATQYALLTSLAAVGRTTLSASAGVVAEGVGWFAFFAISTAAALPGLLLLWWLIRRGVIGGPADDTGMEKNLATEKA